jgi:tRNA pseudouridine55 synthase
MKPREIMYKTDQLQNSSLSGLLIIDKPAGLTSHDVVARVRKMSKTRRVGHTGTLDPFATGVLVVCVNRATRLVQFLTGEDKEYVATMRLGYATDTGDLTGKPVSAISSARDISVGMVAEVLKGFCGRIYQMPPMYSAKKIGGVKLYQMARRGEEVKRDPVEIEIKELELCGQAEIFDDSTQDLTFRVVCSSGTYIRTLAEDIGRRLSIGAHLTGLRRTQVGSYGLSRAVTLEKLTEPDELGRNLIPASEAAPFPAILLNEEEHKAIIHGRSIRRSGYWQEGDRAKLLSSTGELVAIANFDAEKHVWHPIIVLV